MSRIVLAFRSFFAILFTGQLPREIAERLGFAAPRPPAPAPKPAPQARPADGALQILGILQRDSRLIDFLMEDISAYSDDQVGAAVRTLHDQSRESLNRYLHLVPVIDGVEGSFTKLDTNDPASVKLLGNVPVKGRAPGGLLRHKGWRADKVDLPPVPSGQNANILAPAEVEIE
ncbi:MAG TPA: DUF2760 domain-containing protein [Bryobacteraceae bacterium]|nr:DUF2760 domain-containing protein [Bryobacteraceae bacterium]